MRTKQSPRRYLGRQSYALKLKAAFNAAFLTLKKALNDAIINFLLILFILLSSLLIFNSTINLTPRLLNLY